MRLYSLLRWLDSPRSRAPSDAAASMSGVNAYHRALSAAEVAAGAHRDFVGGLWDELGALQLRFLVEQGLRPDHGLVDIGCGALRGGVPFIRYLDSDRYCGLDINASLVDAGRQEVEAAGLAEKLPRLLVNDRFELHRFGRRFDFGIAHSLLTHLYLNHIGRCFREMARVMHAESRFYCSFFEAPFPAWTEPMLHPRGGYTTHYDSDPFHQAFAELRDLANACGLTAAFLGNWGHPRDQKMIMLTLRE